MLDQFIHNELTVFIIPFCRKLVHYAAACSSTSSLEYLESVGANMEDVDRQGITPLMISCMVSLLRQSLLTILV